MASAQKTSKRCSINYMRTIEYATQFKRDYRRLLKNPQYRRLEEWLQPIIDALVHDRPITAPPTRDHELSGRWSNYRELHVRPDLLLIYSLSDADTLRLARLGSHSELFG